MNKKDIANLRKQLKVNNELLKIHEIFNVYIMKESSDVYHQQSMPFEMLEVEQQELFMDNFKKVLTGQLDEKLFELKFQKDVEDNSQLILHQGLLSSDVEEWKEYMLQLVEKMLKDKQYEMDIVVTFIRGEYRKPAKRRSEEKGDEQDTVYSHSFILCSMNKTEDPKKELLFDYVEKEFKYHFVVDPIINLKVPISGFLFPCFTDQTADVNHVLYSTGKKYELDYHLIEEVLNAEETMTAEDDKVVFEEVVNNVAGEQMNTSTLSNVYDEIYRVIEENEEEEETPTLDYRDVEKVLSSSGVKDVDSSKVESAFKTVIDDENYELKARNIVPKSTSKSIKIKTKVADISISPQDLRFVHQVYFDGKVRLMIDVEENTVIEGFEMIPEVLFNKVDEEK